MQVAVLIEEALVSGAKPSVGEGASIGVRIIFVAAKHIGSLDGNFTSLIGCQVIALGVQDADADSGSHSH